LEETQYSYVVVEDSSEGHRSRYVISYSILKRYLTSVDSTMKYSLIKFHSILDSLFNKRKILNINLSEMGKYWIQRESGWEDIRVITQNFLIKNPPKDFEKFLNAVGIKMDNNGRYELNYNSKYKFSKDLIEYLFIHKVFVVENDGHIYLFDLRKFPEDSFLR